MLFETLNFLSPQMQSRPKFAICMTTFANQRIEYIVNMMKSLFPGGIDEGFHHALVIHVDNWSDEEHLVATIGKLFTSPQVFEAYLQHTYSKNVVVITSPRRIGVSESRNKLVKYVVEQLPTVKYVKFSDDDDESVPMRVYDDLLMGSDDVCVIEGTSTLKRVNNCPDHNSIIQTCIKNDYLLTSDFKILDSIGKFSKGVVWTLIMHVDVAKEIPFLPLTSFEDSFFRYMLYEYCRIKKVKYINIPDVVYVYHGASGNANNYGRKITGNDLNKYDELYMKWCGEKIDYAQMLKFVFPFIYTVQYIDKNRGTAERCKTVRQLSNSIVDFQSFRSKFIPDVNDPMFNQKLNKMLKYPESIRDTDIYYSTITQYNLMHKQLRYVNLLKESDESKYEPKTLKNMMEKYPPKNNESVIDCYNKFGQLTGEVVRESIFHTSYIGDDYDYYNKYVINGIESDVVMSNNILFLLLKKSVNSNVFVKKAVSNVMI